MKYLTILFKETIYFLKESNDNLMSNISFVFFMFFLTGVLSQEKPNILWITIEDTSPQFLGCYGNKDASTPVIDKLAKEGVRFTNAFSTGAVCSPSRNTIITGVRTFKLGTGHHRSGYTIPDFIHGFPYYMKQEGYYVTNNYKTDYNVSDGKKFINDAWNESSKNAGWWKRDSDQPFFSIFNFMESHQSRTMTKSYDWYIENVWNQLPQEDRIAENEFKMPPIYYDSPDMRKYFARVYNSIKLTDNRIGELLDKLDKENLRDDTIIFFYADHGEGIPRGKTNGIDMGYRVPFVIWFPEKYKHLSPWGTSGVVTDELISFEDLATTMIDLVGAKAPDYLKGRVLLGKNRSKKVDHLILSTDRADNAPDLVRSITDGRYMYSRNFMPFIPQMRHINYMEIGDITKEMRSDLSKGKLDSLQKSVFEVRPAEFLFDHQNDKWETINLADNPQYKEILSKMREQLDEDIIQSRDVHFLPEYEIGHISKISNAYEFRLDNNKYPIKEIYAAASLSGKQGLDVAKKQVAFLKSKNKIIRYWSIVGLRSQKSEILKPFQKEIIKAIDDAYLPVAVTAAAISYDNFDNTLAQTKMKEFCNHKNRDIALMAVNYLLYVKNKNPFLETIKAIINDSKNNGNVDESCTEFMRIMDAL
tara:strand:- start:45889 stop:47823 length:1935 start_codon:yes stop_codon:yes gene_type:complete